MNSAFRRWIRVAVVFGVAALGGCNGDGTVGPQAPPANTNNSENFSTLATQIYAQSANSTPFNFENVTIVYDVNDDPTAFDALLMM